MKRFRFPGLARLRTTDPTPYVRPDRNAYISAEPEIRGDLYSLFGEHDELVIFDVGACEGEDSVRYSRLFPRARVFAAEPVPANITRCRATVERYGAPNVEILPFALADADGIRTLHLSSGSHPQADGREDWDFGNKSSSLLEPGLHLSVHPWVQFTDQVDVETRRLDSVCLDLGIDRVDFMHIDVQGAELLVLEGAGAFLRTVRAIWLEVEAVPLYREQPLAPDVARFLAEHGFSLGKDTVDAVSGDQLWVRTDA